VVFVEGCGGEEGCCGECGLGLERGRVWGSWVDLVWGVVGLGGIIILKYFKKKFKILYKLVKK
jgi:hypothetical protein